MRKLLIFSLLVLSMSIASVSAQDEESNPLLEMLAKIPAELSAQEWLTYIDYHAIIAARPGAPQVTSWDEASAALDSDEQDNPLLMSALMSYQSGPQEIAQYLMQAGESIDVIGLDLFAIERAIQFANPPASVTILEGDFDTDAISSAFADLDYTESDEAGLMLLCPANGCDTGMEQNLANRDPANVFGGQLGRSQPLLMGENWIASSPSDTALNSVIAAVSDDSESLADLPAYQVAANVLSAKGTVLQAYFILPTMIGGSITDILLMNSRMTQEQVEAILERLEADFEPMPAYSLVVLAEVATAEEDLTVIVLIYPDGETAATAAEVLPARIENYTSLVTQQVFSEMLEDRGVTSIDTEVVEGEERAALVLTLNAPLPGTDTPEGASRPQQLGMVYNLFVRSYMMRDMGWLATSLN